MNTLAAAALVVFLLAPRIDQCDQINFARANPGLCYSGPLGQLPPTGGGPRGGGGLIGRIIHAIGGLL